MIDKSAIIQAHVRIKPYIERTPVLHSRSIDEISGCTIYFKCENFQKIGAFKARGAMNAALSFSKEERVKGFATHSSGNHAQAVARAAKILNVPAYIVMPNNVSEVKKQGVIALEGEIFYCEPNQDSRESKLREVMAKTGSKLIHPFNDQHVIAGQGTCAKELFEEVDELDYLLAPVGGGGLLSGSALSTHFFSPSTKVIAGEPAGADDTYRSMKSGKIEPSQADTIADGLLTSLGELTFTIIREHVHEIITVSDNEIVAAMKLLWERLKTVVEPSAAVPLAALLKNKETFAGKSVGIILSGGNIDLKRAGELFSEY